MTGLSALYFEGLGRDRRRFMPSYEEPFEQQTKPALIANIQIQEIWQNLTEVLVDP